MVRTDVAVEMLTSHCVALVCMYFFNIYSCSIHWGLYGDFHLDQRAELRGTENVSDELSSADEKDGRSPSES